MNNETSETMDTSEGTIEHRATYIHHIYPVVECTFKLWHENKMGYQSAAPVRYQNMSRDQALTALEYALNTGDPQVNPFKLRYTDIHTRGTYCHQREGQTLTGEQERLYQRLFDYCQQFHMWVGTEAKLAVFADLSYPIDRAITYGLQERGLIKITGSINCWMVVCDIRGEHQ